MRWGQELTVILVCMHQPVLVNVETEREKHLRTQKFRAEVLPRSLTLTW